MVRLLEDDLNVFYYRYCKSPSNMTGTWADDITEWPVSELTLCVRDRHAAKVIHICLKVRQFSPRLKTVIQTNVRVVS